MIKKVFVFLSKDFCFIIIHHSEVGGKESLFLSELQHFFEDIQICNFIKVVRKMQTPTLDISQLPNPFLAEIATAFQICTTSLM